MARYGLWPTPHGSGVDGHGSVLSQSARASSGVEVPEKSLSRAKRNRYHDPDQDEPETSGLWPTPRESDWRGSGPLGSPSHLHRLGIRGDRVTGATLDAAVQERQQQTGALNPAWVEWLMGFPVGWTDLTVDAPDVLAGDPWPADPHPDVPRILGKVPGRKHRLRQIGNAVVPRVAEVNGLRLLELLTEAT